MKRVSHKSAPVILTPCAIGFRKNSTERWTAGSSVTTHRLFTIRTASSRRGLQLIRGESNKVIIAKHLLGVPPCTAAPTGTNLCIMYCGGNKILVTLRFVDALYMVKCPRVIL